MQKEYLTAKLSPVLDKDLDIENVTHIVFDLGRVLVSIDQHATFNAFRALGAQGLDDIADDYLNLEVLHRFESGQLTTAGFFETLRVYMPAEVTDEQIKNAWCAMVGRMPLPVVTLLQQLRPHYRLLMLSNTNGLHIDYLEQQLRNEYDGLQLASLFDALYLSHQIGAMKPDPAIYQCMLRYEAIQPGRALFIDDRIENVEGARREGISAVHLKPGQSLLDLFLVSSY